MAFTGSLRGKFMFAQKTREVELVVKGGLQQEESMEQIFWKDVQKPLHCGK